MPRRGQAWNVRRTWLFSALVTIQALASGAGSGAGSGAANLIRGISASGAAGSGGSAKANLIHDVQASGAAASASSAPPAAIRDARSSGAAGSAGSVSAGILKNVAASGAAASGESALANIFRSGNASGAAAGAGSAQAGAIRDARASGAAVGAGSAPSSAIRDARSSGAAGSAASALSGRIRGAQASGASGGAGSAPPAAIRDARVSGAAVGAGSAAGGAIRDARTSGAAVGAGSALGTTFAAGFVQAKASGAAAGAGSAPSTRLLSLAYWHHDGAGDVKHGAALKIATRSIENYVSVAQTDVAGWPTTTASVSFWARHRRSDYAGPVGALAGVISYATAGPPLRDNDLLIYLDRAGTGAQGQVHCRIAGGPGDPVVISSTVPALLEGHWHHVGVTWRSSDGTVSFYVDGAPQGTATGHATGLAIRTGGFLFLGQEQDSVGGSLTLNSAYVGSLDEVRIYGRELTAAEMVEHAKGHYLNDTNLALAWSFDDRRLDSVDDPSGARNYGTGFGALLVDEDVPEPLRTLPGTPIATEHVGAPVTL